MIIIPFDKPLDWRNPPLITLLLIILNCAIFFIVQGDDDRAMNQAMTYYFDSGLDKQELSVYAKRKDLDSASTPSLLFDMQADHKFMQSLRNDQIITPKTEGYSDWRRKRNEFERLLNDVSWWRLGLKPGELEWRDLISHFFLHGGLGHLIGNMLFLFAVGFIVEATLGKLIYLGCYLIVGLGAAGFNILITPDSMIPGIGASGAITGLMGLYAVLFGRQRVSFFYFALVYFDFIKAPAIILLILWLGWEVSQQLVYSEFSNINYLAHIGGLVSGAAIGFVISRFTALADRDYIEQNQRDEIFTKKINRAEVYMQELDFARAKSILLTLHREKPQNRALLYQLYLACRAEPDNDDYNEVCKTIFNLSERDPATLKLIADTARDYLQQAQLKPQQANQHIKQLATQLLEQYS